MLSLLLIAAVFLPSQAQIGEFTPCQECPRISLQQYEAKNCTPVFDDSISRCCPSSFVCKTEEERGMKLDACYVQGKEYAIHDNLPLENISPCRVGCNCAESFQAGEPARIECAIVDCPSAIVGLEPGCREVYDLDDCCGTIVCGEDEGPTPSPLPPSPPILGEEGVVPRHTGTCNYGGKQYAMGDQMFFDEDPCRVCICNESFVESQGPRNRYCRDVSCGMEYFERTQLRQNCIPIYYKGLCCSTDWICPDNTDRLKPTPAQISSTPGNSTTHCTLGNITAARGETLATDNCNLNCQCSFPPEFTCVQFTDCDQARDARLSGSLP